MNLVTSIYVALFLKKIEKKKSHGQSTSVHLVQTHHLLLVIKHKYFEEVHQQGNSFCATRWEFTVSAAAPDLAPGESNEF